MATNILIRATLAGHAAKIEKLIAREDIRELAQQHVSQKNTQTALILAATCGDVECVKLLAPVSDVAHQGCEAPYSTGPNGRRQSALQIAVEHAGNPAHLECVRILAPLALPRMTASGAYGVLKMALKHDSSECLNILLAEPAAAAGARLVSTSTLTRDGHPTQATLLMERECLNNLDHFKALLPFCDPNAVDRKGEHVLIHAMHADDRNHARRAGPETADRVRLLIAAGANPSGVIRELSDYEKSPLARAAVAGYAAVVDAMLPASEPMAIHFATMALNNDFPTAQSGADWSTRRSRGRPEALDSLCAVDLSSHEQCSHHAELRREGLSGMGAAKMPKTYALVEAAALAQALKDAAPQASAAASSPDRLAQAIPSLRSSGAGARARRM